MGRGGKPISRLRADRGARKDVQNNAKTTGKRPGGITGKGFVPGQSGNPGGRPSKRPLTMALVRIGESELPDRWRKKLGLWTGATWFEAIAMATVHEAAKGNPAAAKEIRKSIEGKSPQPIELTAEFDFVGKSEAHKALLMKLGIDVDDDRIVGPVQ
jgi:hypothetical protein